MKSDSRIDEMLPWAAAALVGMSVMFNTWVNLLVL